MAARIDIVFLHCLQQGCLRLGRSTVDFIRENDIRKDRALHELIGSTPGNISLLQDVGTRDVRRHKIRCELDAAKGQVHHLAK